VRASVDKAGDSATRNAQELNKQHVTSAPSRLCSTSSPCLFLAAAISSLSSASFLSLNSRIVSCAPARSFSVCLRHPRAHADDGQGEARRGGRGSGNNAPCVVHGGKAIPSHQILLATCSCGAGNQERDLPRLTFRKYSVVHTFLPRAFVPGHR
jgi:hypothetical protein